MTQAAQVVARVKQRGNFCYARTLAYSPGFFQGASGIDYELLRFAVSRSTAISNTLGVNFDPLSTKVKTQNPANSTPRTSVKASLAKQSCLDEYSLSTPNRPEYTTITLPLSNEGYHRCGNHRHRSYR